MDTSIRFRNAVIVAPLNPSTSDLSYFEDTLKEMDRRIVRSLILGSKYFFTDRDISEGLTEIQNATSKAELESPWRYLSFVSF